MAEIVGEFTALPLAHVRFGAGSVSELAHEVERVGGKRAFVITGQSLATQTDVVERVTAVLGKQHVGTFSAIRQHAPESGIKQAMEQVRAAQADVLISVGGGSPIDSAKVVAYKLAQESGTFLPHIAIPTTLSAAEFAPTAGYTDEASKSKTGITDLRITPRAVVLDSALTLATPQQLWLSSGIRALDHAVETLYAPGVHPINDALALEGFHDLYYGLQTSKAQPGDLDVRTRLQLAAWMSMFAAPNAPMGLSHKLGRRIGATYNVPHGITSCITLPVVMHAMAEEHRAALARLVDALRLPDSAVPKNTVEAAHLAADKVYQLIHDLGLPQHLRDFGISESDLHDIAINTVGEGLQLARIEELLRQML